ncbi:MAG: hypothetical protein NTY48_04805 [Candidatus Diapherotrites archaeon]|nr:hypothetical protein [Candidatus Diapherotrites archaeon]
MAMDFLGALAGDDLFLTLALILFVIYFLWIYAWAKKQIGPGLGLVLAIVITWILFYNFPDLIWVPFLLFLWSIFGKDLLEKIPKPNTGRG